MRPYTCMYKNRASHHHHQKNIHKKNARRLLFRLDAHICWNVIFSGIFSGSFKWHFYPFVYFSKFQIFRIDESCNFPPGQKCALVFQILSLPPFRLCLLHQWRIAKVPKWYVHKSETMNSDMCISNILAMQLSFMNLSE